MLNGYVGTIVPKGNKYNMTRLVFAESSEDAKEILEKEFGYMKPYDITIERKYEDVKSGTIIKVLG